MKKINIGIILIVLAVIGFVGYMQIDKKNKEREYQEVKKFIDNYIEVASKYSLLPEEYRDLETDMKEEEYNEYLSKMKSELSDYILEQQQDYIFKNYESILQEQRKSKFVYKEYEVQTEYPGYYDIIGDVILVSLEENVKASTYSRLSPSFNEDTEKYIGKIKFSEGVRKQPVGMMLKKDKNGKYKVISHMKYPYVPR